MPEILEQFNKRKDCWPSENFDTFGEWTECINKMIYHFKESNDDTCSEVNEYKDTFNENREKYFKREREIAKYKDKHLEEAMKLFSKYIRDL